MSIPPPDGSFSQTYDGTTSVSPDDKTMAMLSYILGIFTSFVGPLVIWLMKKDQSKFVGFHALQALLLQAAIAIGYIIAVVLTLVFIGWLLFPVVGILSLVFSILAALAANRGEWYEIPLVGSIARQQTSA